MSLPDIEAYIDQKIPTAHVEPELLIALPRPERVKPEGETESVSAIFKEAREFQDAQNAKKGDSPAKKRSPRRRKPRPEGATADGEQRATTSSPAPQTATTNVDEAPKDEVRAKRRRRRKPKRPHETTVPTETPVAPKKVEAATSAPPKKAGLVTRVSNKLKNLFGGKK